MTINTDLIRPSIPTVTTGDVSTVTNTKESDVSETVENLRIQTANKLGISVDELGGDATVTNATNKMSDILLKYQSARTATSESVMLDVYSIMNLVQEMAQKLRDAMREMRQLEMTVVQSQIQSQASQQRAAAMTQLVTGIVTFAVQAGVTIAGTAQQLKALGQEATAKATQGVDVAKQQADIAQLADSPKALDKQVDGLKSTFSKEAISEVDAQIEKCDIKEANTKLQADVTAKKGELDKCIGAQAQKEVDAASAKVDAAKVAYDEAKSSGSFEQEDAAKAKLQQANRDLNTAYTNMTTGKCENMAAPEVLKANQEYQMADFKLKAFQKHSGTIDNGAPSYSDITAQCQVDYNKALSEVNAERSNGGVSAESAAKLEKCGQKLVYAQAKEIQHLQGTNDGNVKINEISQRLQQQLGTKLQAAGIDSNKTSKVMVYASLMTNVSQMLGQMGQQIGNTVSEYQKATATEMQADQKASEEQLDQLRDMFSEMLQTVEKALSLYQSVAQTETQTIDEIAGAIRS